MMIGCLADEDGGENEQRDNNDSMENVLKQRRSEAEGWAEKERWTGERMKGLKLT